MAFSTVGADLSFNGTDVGNVVSISISGLTTEALDATEMTDNSSKYLPGRQNEGTLTAVVRPSAVSNVATLRAMSGDGPSAIVVTDGAESTPTTLLSVHGTLTDVAGPELDGAGLAEMTMTWQLEPTPSS